MTWLQFPRSDKEAWGLRSGAWGSRNHSGRFAVWHTTGNGPIRRWRKNKDRFADPFTAALWLYTKAMRAGPHFVICGETGRIRQIAPLSAVAWHVGRRGAWRYKEGYNPPDWWRERWPELEGPQDLAQGLCWRGGSCNEWSVGIEIVPSRKKGGVWSNACWQTVRLLSGTLEREIGIPLFRGFHLGHSDAHPWARTTKGGRPWDPPPNLWTPEIHYWFCKA